MDVRQGSLPSPNQSFHFNHRNQSRLLSSTSPRSHYPSSLLFSQVMLEIAMESKKHTYSPIPSSDDIPCTVLNVDERSSGDIPWDPHQKSITRSRWIRSPLLASTIVLNLLIAALIIVTLRQEATVQQCTQQLSVYCK
jgi:hypothetical protein